jgi:hypothetical protein
MDSTVDILYTGYITKLQHDTVMKKYDDKDKSIKNDKDTKDVKSIKNDKDTKDIKIVKNTEKKEPVKKDIKSDSESEKSTSDESAEDSTDEELTDTDDEKTAKKKEDANSPKIKILLKILNHILQSGGNPQITSIYDFKKVDREIIIKTENENFLEKNEKEIFMHFDKSKCGWYRKASTTHYILCFFRATLPYVDAKFTYKRTHINKTMVTLYSVV